MKCSCTAAVIARTVPEAWIAYEGISAHQRLEKDQAQGGPSPSELIGKGPDFSLRKASGHR